MAGKHPHLGGFCHAQYLPSCYSATGTSMIWGGTWRTAQSRLHLGDLIKVLAAGLGGRTPLEPRAGK